MVRKTKKTEGHIWVYELYKDLNTISLHIHVLCHVTDSSLSKSDPAVVQNLLCFSDIFNIFSGDSRTYSSLKPTYVKILLVNRQILSFH